MYFQQRIGDVMYTDKEWDKIVDEFQGKRAVVYCTDGTRYEGVGGPYCEAEDSAGENTWAITLDCTGNDSMIFLREDVEKIEYL